MSELTPLLIDMERLSARMRRVSPECADMLYTLWEEYAGEEDECVCAECWRQVTVVGRDLTRPGVDPVPIVLCVGCAGEEGE